MIKLSFFVRSSELRILSDYINYLIKEKATIIDIADYYNLITLCKKLADKSFLLYGKFKAKVKISVCLNTYNSLNKVDTDCLGIDRHRIVFRVVMNELNQKFVSIPRLY